jgi:DNA invertase Pin-like site-specific DNA recombinase
MEAVSPPGFSFFFIFSLGFFMENIETSSVPITYRAAMYVRMSTDHQNYSIEHQIIAIRAYAQHRGFSIVETYADPGKSGLTFEKRSALKELVETVQSGLANFKNILVLDVSRWGRFQDTDESAYYEYICRKSSIKLHYVAEPFENDGQPLSAIVKTIKRTMAAEYSRELSEKVSKARHEFAKKGFQMGGRAPYGLCRATVDCEGNF